MKTKIGFNLRQICGENVIIAVGVENIDFSNIISMKESSAYLWKNIQDKEFSEVELVKLLTEEYDVDEITAKSDVDSLVKSWLNAGIIE